MLFFTDVPGNISQAFQSTVQEAENSTNDNTKPTTKGGGRREFSESEQIWRQHKVYSPQLVDTQVPGTTRIGKVWV